METSEPNTSKRVGPYCRGYNHLYLKANGEIPCWCSTGESVILQNELASLGRDFGRRVVNGDALRRVRRSFLSGRVAFPQCGTCELFRESTPSNAWSDLSDDESGAISGVQIFQVESSFLCTLDCPMCVGKSSRTRLKGPPYNLPFPLFQNAVTGLADEEISVRELSFCGRGEPFLNPDLLRMVAFAKERLKTRATIITNGNCAFDPDMVKSGLDRIEISWDGTDKATYSKYRIHGSFQKVLDLTSSLADFKKTLGAPNPRIMVKYILFSWNDSEEQLLRLFDMTRALCVDEILFVFTDTLGKSKRFLHSDQIEDLLSRKVREGSLSLPSRSYLNTRSTVAQVRFFHEWSIEGDAEGRSVNILGWFVDANETERMESGIVLINGNESYPMEVNLPSMDLVRARHCEAIWPEDPLLRFRATIPLSCLAGDAAEIEVVVRTTEGRTVSLGKKAFKPAGVSRWSRLKGALLRRTRA